MDKRENETGQASRPVSMESRSSKVSIEGFAAVPGDLSWWPELERLFPRILAGSDRRDLADRVAMAVKEQRPVILMMGAHVVKCGLGALIGSLIRERVVTSVAMNGACAIHDVELAIWGRTSENVEDGLRSGDFGMTEEIAGFFNQAAAQCLEEEIGFGNALKKRLAQVRPQHAGVSVIAACSGSEVPLTVHVAVGTDVVHQNEEADGRAIGYGTMKDFRLFARQISDLNGGVVINLGSAVIMPEVFLKAMALARNRGAELGAFTAANFDMFSLYRPRVNLVERPRLIGGRTFSFLGHHEILLPVFFASLLSRVRS
jgi:hypothetical protein